MDGEEEEGEEEDRVCRECNYSTCLCRQTCRMAQQVRTSGQAVLPSPSFSRCPEDWCWSWSSNTLATGCKELTHWKRPWCWERLKAGEGDDLGWDGWMASPTQWTWVWVSSGTWWRTGKPGVPHAVHVADSDMTERLNGKRGETSICTIKLSCFKERRKKKGQANQKGKQNNGD